MSTVPDEDYPLFQRYPALSSISRVPLAHLPTPITRMDHCSATLGINLWIKRDDLSHDVYGGNKCRKYEFIIGHILSKGCRRVYTAGAAGSNHIVAFSYFGSLHDLDTTFWVLNYAPMNKTIRENLLLCQNFGAHMTPKRSLLSLGASLAKKFVQRLGRSVHFQYGASTKEAVLGYVNAGFELVEQLRNGILPRPIDRIFIPVGTMGTLLGIFLGLELAFDESEPRPLLHGVIVMPNMYNSNKRMENLCRSVVELMQEFDSTVPDLHERLWDRVVLERRFIGEGGYAWPTVQGRRATDLARHDGFEFDDVYMGKVFSALIHFVQSHQNQNEHQNETILLWTTKNGQDVTQLIQNENWRDLPRSLHKYYDGTLELVEPVLVDLEGNGVLVDEMEEESSSPTFEGPLTPFLREGEEGEFSDDEVEQFS